MNAADSISVIVPVYNEEASLRLLVPALVGVLEAAGRPFEIITVNDGSVDGSAALLAELASAEPRLKTVTFARNFGQTAAMMAGFDHATGAIIIPIDADLQNDPLDIPRLLTKLDEGYDVVSGWRKNRHDAAIRRNFLSRCANGVISWLSGVRLHDYGCSLKAYRRSVVGQIKLYGEMHRFIPIYASWYGARITEIEVTHHKRRFGKSNYGMIRIIKVILDLIVVCFLDRYVGKPIYLFGGFGLLWLLISALTLIDILYLKIFKHLSMILTPLPSLAAMAFMMGVMSILLGLLAEIAVRIYFATPGRTSYVVRETANFAPVGRTA
ncbi:MAG: glycosyltransferase [Acidocella sp. 20-57-95]|nr:MAG: glycosyltransferase [Acidocella sp. 20-57-95]OYV59958.1 MAG: glycosyltransferase [Acidocella sp. 21-58-7]HQT63113.1 glycosyltransferase family 2 protein [Acidocella sp.]HQU04788.1 glycosyltransferase family 2 protein [Acidocella sp.]